jgi:hypothetical protein
MSSANPNIKSRLRALYVRLGINDTEIAALAAVAPAVIRAARRDGRVPTRAPTRRRLLDFVERADRAENRAALGLP